MNKKQEIMKGALITGVINAGINGVINYFMLRDHDILPISVDSITNNNTTVLGEVVKLSIILAVILTLVSYFTIKENKVPFFPTALWLTVKHGFFTFGILTSLAVIWQKSMGTVEVSFITGILLIAVISGIVSAIVQYMTITSSLKQRLI